jgi:hypothetical protein
MAVHYIMDAYHQPEGAADPVLWKATRVGAQNDAEAIREAKVSFRSLVEANPSVTGFSLRRIGFRRAGDHIIHMQNTASVKQQLGPDLPAGNPARPAISGLRQPG